ncbi:hypothetical protein H8A97_15455 [Bradyrhizobium sp. Arg62]|uniref:hypothetical protein n=1 Tax=Bradyrhizobium brasilense TaxID=1419277 RepID=UPI001E650849|nr:hypothetical protein [Bradyrhizobium brasilense]MCC8946472.1 hypothetical protein [Bradyrhizobium brasilense]
MSETISHPYQSNKPPKIALLAPYPDSFDFSSTQRFHPALIRAVQANVGSAFPKPIKDRNNPEVIWGYRLVVNQPSRFCIDLLQLYSKIDPKFSFYRCHVAFDVIQIYEGWTYEEVADALKNLFHLRYRRLDDDVLEYEDSTYSIYVKMRKSRPYRNTCFYNGKPSKITGEENAIHLEIRLERKRAVQAAGVNEPIDILGIKPAEIFSQFLIAKDHRHVLEEITKTGIRLTCGDYPDEDPAHIERRIRAINRRLGLHHVSMFAGYHKHSFNRLDRWDCVDIEGDWNWATPDAPCVQDVRELRSLLPPQAPKPKIQRERL